MPTTKTTIEAIEVALLTPEQAAQVLQVSRRTVFHLLSRGTLSSVKLGRLRRIPTAEVRALARTGVAEIA